MVKNSILKFKMALNHTHLLKSIEKQVMLQDRPYSWPQSAPFSTLKHLTCLARRITRRSRLTQDVAPRRRLQLVSLCVDGVEAKAALPMRWPIILNALF